VRTLVLAAENVNVSPFLPAAAVMLIVLFTVTLAMAEPRDAPVVASHGAITANPLERGGGLASDAQTDEDAEILSRPLHPPRYHDRYRFYHRYDHGLHSRFNPIDDGAL
jgi:hypothetical protein